MHSTTSRPYDPADTLDAPHIGERVLTGRRLTLPEGMEAMLPLLAEQTGVVTARAEHRIRVEDGADIYLRTANVRLDTLPEHELTFGLDELFAPDDEN